MGELFVIVRILFWIVIAIWVSYNYWKEQQGQSKPHAYRSATRHNPRKPIPRGFDIGAIPPPARPVPVPPLPDLDVDDVFPALPPLEPPTKEPIPAPPPVPPTPAVHPSKLENSNVCPPSPPPAPSPPPPLDPSSPPAKPKPVVKQRSLSPVTQTLAIKPPPPPPRPAAVPPLAKAAPILPEPELEPEIKPELEPETVAPAPPPITIPDYFTPLPKPQVERKRRKPTQFYPNLVRLLGGDEKAADRLIQGLLDAYPDKSERWCYEKALFDLTRDRH